MAKRKSSDSRVSPGGSRRPTAVRVRHALAALKKLSNARTRDEMGPRYGIHAARAFGTPVGKIQGVAKELVRESRGRDHALASALWRTGWYEARLLACFVDDPAEVTPAQMDAWCRDFDNWGVCDTVCFHLFDRAAPELVIRKVRGWSKRTGEFQRRAAFALLASAALHNAGVADDTLRGCLALIEQGAEDDRNFVKKGVSWALRLIGRRRPALRRDAIALARRLAGSPRPAPRWVGKDALRDLTR